MIEERFAHGDSFLHRRDPRGKIVAAFTFSATIAMLHSLPALFLGVALGPLFLVLAKTPFGLVARRLLLVNSFTLFLWISLPLTYGGELTHEFSGFSLSGGGIQLAALITLKTNAIIMAVIALLATSTIAELGYALDRLHLPQKLVFMLLYSYRYIFVIYQEYNRLLRAAKLRSFSPRTNLHTYRTFAYLFGMTLVKSYNRSQRVHQAMVLRGFNGRLVSLHRYRFSLVDGLFLVTLLLLSVLLVITATC